MYERLQKTFWTIIFSLMFLYFVYALCFISEKNRISNESAKIGAFMMALCLLVSYLLSTKWYNKLMDQKKEREYQQRRMSRQKIERRDKDQIDNLLRNSLREALVREQ